jgi:epoxide hydrolase
VDYWLRRFDWRQVEARINTFPQFTADVRGARMHFVYRRSQSSGAPTVVVLHGWPYTFVEMLPLAAALQEADVVVPSLPGFGFSAIPHGYVATSQAIADTVHLLVTEGLGRAGEPVAGGDPTRVGPGHPRHPRGVRAP